MRRLMYICMYTSTTIFVVCIFLNEFLNLVQKQNSILI